MNDNTPIRQPQPRRRRRPRIYRRGMRITNLNVLREHLLLGSWIWIEGPRAAKPYHPSWVLSMTLKTVITKLDAGVFYVADKNLKGGI